MINPSDIPGIGLFDMDKASIETFGPVVHLDRNGFLYCTRGRIDLALNERVYEIRTGDIYIYPPFSHTYIHEISDDLQCVVGVADFDFVLPVISQVSNARNQVFILENPCISLDGRQRVRIGELIAALMAKIGLMRQSASPEQIRTTAKTELAEKLDIDIDTLLDEPDFIGRLTDEYGFGDQELDKFAELLFDMVAASEQHAERLRLAAAVGAIYSYLDAKKAPASLNRYYILKDLEKYIKESQ